MAIRLEAIAITSRFPFHHIPFDLTAEDVRNFGGRDPVEGYLKQCQCYTEDLPVEGISEYSDDGSVNEAKVEAMVETSN